VREARAVRARAQQAAAEARRRASRAAAEEREGGERASDEDLGYVTTDDSFTKLIDDAWDGFRSWLGDVRRKD
jgi:hypothetical protein